MKRIIGSIAAVVLALTLGVLHTLSQQQNKLRPEDYGFSAEGFYDQT